MGEAKRRSLSKSEIISSAKRCVYCDSTQPTTLEHMPPRGLFRGKDRPSGWEFACCSRCNEGSRGADAVAQLLALVEPISKNLWKETQIIKAMAAVEKFAPRVAEELQTSGKPRQVWLNQKGLLHEAFELRADGSSTKAHLDTFSAKIAMATFANYIGRPMDMSGLIYTQWFLNVGMGRDAYHATLAKMPLFGELRQGKKTSGYQFNVHYNTDSLCIVFALVSLHGSLTIIVLASDSDEYTDALKDVIEPIAFNIGSQLTTLGLPGLEELQAQAS